MVNSNVIEQLPPYFGLHKLTKYAGPRQKGHVSLIGNHIHIIPTFFVITYVKLLNWEKHKPPGCAVKRGEDTKSSKACEGQNKIK
ncbi:hypothetical protein POVWA2_019200 [Plasmodium ovale wallikeri]|uniref:Uncharacterized protein n=1 Tax=Plasmodium ovale wallikeri TaxID=864142 RepID=A0A1A8YVP0_PLAOA|nr:hypothetical protein POVWA2_019200 [Plasmodium ovale wallikeri]SBT35516.1 hypothetical protein POVWA1_027690 [Plasmodium ovale wallikeri]